MRTAELTMAVFGALFSAFLMWESAKLPIGWEAERGPGAGAFPFWLATGMLVSSIWIFLRGLRGVTPQAQSTAPYMDGESLKLFAITAGALAVMLGLIHVVGVYVALPLFFVFFVRLIGRHSWATTLGLAIATPVVLFLFFEVGMKILLPKGITEPLFYPLYGFFF